MLDGFHSHGFGIVNIFLEIKFKRKVFDILYMQINLISFLLREWVLQVMLKGSYRPYCHKSLLGK